MLLLLVLVLKKLTNYSTKTAVDQVCVYMDMPFCAVFPPGSNETILIELKQIFIVSGPILEDHCDFIGVGTYYFWCMYLLDHLQDDVSVVLVVCRSSLLVPLMCLII